MAVSYNKLWKLLIDKKMKKKELGEAAGISNSLIAKLGKNENVTVEVLVKICTALDCQIEDIVELTSEDDWFLMFDKITPLERKFNYVISNLE